ncbi:hypothetical protein RRG08_038729 [Elysia crispata]|uniref:Uncharacterized protein n=1 Tax=Elysia crispata TaxID=231223 RepID=A0AAE1DI11_9GAST|nr:hypothetical protein RRG08_038729 [Elysia crispata]
MITAEDIGRPHSELLSQLRSERQKGARRNCSPVLALPTTAADERRERLENFWPFLARKAERHAVRSLGRLENFRTSLKRLRAGRRVERTADEFCSECCKNSSALLVILARPSHRLRFLSGNIPEPCALVPWKNPKFEAIFLPRPMKKLSQHMRLREESCQ